MHGRKHFPFETVSAQNTRKERCEQRPKYIYFSWYRNNAETMLDSAEEFVVRIVSAAGKDHRTPGIIKNIKFTMRQRCVVRFRSWSVVVIFHFFFDDDHFLSFLIFIFIIYLFLFIHKK